MQATVVGGNPNANNWGYPVTQVVLDGQSYGYVYLPYAHATKGTWDADGFHTTGFDLLLIQMTGQSFKVNIDHALTVLEMGTQDFQLHDDLYRSTDNYYLNVGTSRHPYQVDPLFTQSGEVVNFATMTQVEASFGLGYNSLGGMDTVTLPGKTQATRIGYDITQYFHGGRDNDTIIGAADVGDRITGDQGNDTLRGNGGNDTLIGGFDFDRLDGGDGHDTAILEYSRDSTQMGNTRPAFFDDLPIYRSGVVVDRLALVERVQFASGQNLVLTEWAEKTKIPLGVNAGLTNVANANGRTIDTRNAFMIDHMGAPQDNLPTHPNGPHSLASRLVQVLRDEQTIEGIRVTGVTPALDSLREVLAEVRLKVSNLADQLIPKILDNITTDGMLVPRMQGTRTVSISNHTWGTAIDLKVDGLLDHFDDGYTHLALVKMMPIFHRHGWIAGAGFVAEDAMHFEFSREKVNQLFPLWTGTAGIDVRSGGANHDTLRGLGGADTLNGLGGTDTLEGGASSDRLTGGAGKDFFVFNTAPDATANVDTILDYRVADDEIHLSNDIFRGIGAEHALMSAAAFRAGPVAADANDRIVYDRVSGRLFYDDDGSGPHAAVQIASLPNKPALTAAEFWVL